MSDNIDHRVGIIFSKKIGNEVKKGEVLAYIHSNDSQKAEEAIQNLKTAYKIGKKIIKKNNIIEIM